MNGGAPDDARRATGFRLPLCESAAGVLKLGYVLLGWVSAFLFAFGYVGGLVLWVNIPAVTSFRRIRVAYVGAFAEGGEILR